MSDDRDRRELEVLYRLALMLPNSLTVTGVTDSLAVELVRVIDRADNCTICSWDQATDELQVLSEAARQDGIDETWRGVRYSLADWPQDRAVLESAEMRDYRRDDPRFTERQRAQFDEWDWCSWLVFPLIVENRPVGLIDLVDSTSDAPWSLSDRRFCATVGAQAALAVRNAQLYEDLRRQVDHDALTGLLNHAAFYGRVEEELARIAPRRTAGGGAGDRPRRLQGDQRPGRAPGGRRDAAPGRVRPARGLPRLRRRRPDGRRRVLRAAGGRQRRPRCASPIA